MGRRYQAIFRALGTSVQCVDIEARLEDVKHAVQDSQGAVIASPTPTHAGYCVALAPLGIPILCEKPLSTSLHTVSEILAINAPLQMMAQYRYLDTQEGHTFYDHYHSGNDGLRWDCMQLIGLARGAIWLRQESPIWECQLNGRTLTRELVDEAYIQAVIDWQRNPNGDRSWIRECHERAATFGVRPERASPGGASASPGSRAGH